MRKVIKNIFLGISAIASIYFVSLVIGHPPMGIEQVILYAFPGGILMFFLFDPILNAFGERAKQVQEDNEVLDSISKEDSIITNHLDHKLNKKDVLKNEIIDFLNENPLDIGSILEFRKGQKDFKSWGDGVLFGSEKWVIDKLANKLLEVGANNIGYVSLAKNYSWQKSNLEGFNIRIETSIPDGLLAGYYIGKCSKEIFGLFGYGFNIDESEFPLSVEKEIANGIEESDSNGNEQPNIRNKILECAGPACIRIAEEEEIISLGEKAVPVAVDILKNVKSANQGFLTMVLLHFANNGNVLADQTLFDIAEGKIQIDSFSYGDLALHQAQLYVAEKQGFSPQNLCLKQVNLIKQDNMIRPSLIIKST